MEKVFRDFLRKEFASFMKSVAPQFRDATKEAAFGGDFAGSIAFRWNARPPVVWLALHFVQGRSYVLLRLYWTSGDQQLEPGLLLRSVLDLQQRIRAEGREVALSDYLTLESGYLDASDFDRKLDTFPMSVRRPPRERIRPIMATAEAQKTLAIFDLAGDKWEGSDGTDDWYSIVAYGKEKLTVEDARIALGGTAAALKDFASNHFLPFASSLKGPVGVKSDS